MMGLESSQPYPDPIYNVFAKTCAGFAMVLWPCTSLASASWLWQSDTWTLRGSNRGLPLTITTDLVVSVSYLS